MCVCVILPVWVYVYVCTCMRVCNARGYLSVCVCVCVVPHRFSGNLTIVNSKIIKAGDFLDHKRLQNHLLYYQCDKSAHIALIW